MTAKKPSQTELYGELLTNEQRYHADIAVYEDAKNLTDEQERILVERARAGDPKAYSIIMDQLLTPIKRVASRYFYAYRWASHRIEYLDLIQEGNEAVLRAFERGLQAEQPYAYLTGVARRAIYEYCVRLKAEIKGDEALEVCSLDEPLHGEDATTLLDVLAETLTVDEYKQEESPEQYEPLHRVLQELNPREYLIITRNYGLHENFTWTLSEIEQEQGWGYNGACSVKTKLLLQLYRRLAPLYPHYVNEKGIPPLQRIIKKPKWSLTPEQEHRLKQAHARLQERGERLTIDALRSEAQIAERPTREYLRQYHAQYPSALREQRLDEAYTQLEQEGAFIAAYKLARLAHVDIPLAKLYLEQKRGKVQPSHPSLLTPQERFQAMQERLEQAYQQLETRGERISTTTLKREAHVNSVAVSAFLRQKRSILTQETVAS